MLPLNKPTSCSFHGNFCDATIAYNSAYIGSWTLYFTGAVSSSVGINGIGDQPSIPLAQALSILESGLTPTFTWTRPSGSPAVEAVFIYDPSQYPYQTPSVYRAILTDTPTSFTVPAGTLEPIQLWFQAHPGNEEGH